MANDFNDHEQTLHYKSRLYELLEKVNENNSFGSILKEWFEFFCHMNGVLHASIYMNDHSEEIRCKLTESIGEPPTLPSIISLCHSNHILNEKQDINMQMQIKDNALSIYNASVRFHIDNKFSLIMLFKKTRTNEGELEKSIKASKMESERFLNRLHQLFDNIRKEQQYKELFRITEKFHSSMNIDNVLAEIITTLKRVYPSYTYYLMLSNDDERNTDLPIKDLEFDSENTVAMQAYVNGTIQIEDSYKEKNTILYAPLRGKQGVYGVLQVLAPASVIFPGDEVEFISLLANTAGSALENAKLYQQSRRLISDLQLINETSHRLNSNLRLSDTIQYLKNQIERYFDATEVGFIMLNKDQGEGKVLPGSSLYFQKESGKKYIQFVKEKIKKERDSLFIGDLNNNGCGVPSYEYCSLMAIPMVHSNSMIGFCVVLQDKPYAFTFEMYKLLQSLIHHSTLALSNSMLREELEKMVITDYLTKLYARNYLDDAIANSMVEEEEGTFILVDIDNFKRVNDTYGHQAGDNVIIQVANLIQKNIRSTDIGARWGGEELAIYLPGAPLRVGYSVADRLVKTVQEQTTPSVTVSCGVSYWNIRKTEEVEMLFRRADRALYFAKNNGKNKAVVHEQDLKMMV
ncbi:sensor domain-containing diguanylate cyclase [Falsibacillus pallidus]|uniref:sensor domain-containing diguanylate cyclase n=1 Tax=Falsibacillus pallidus TaxID=493781 RepID=UPI003D98A42C